MEKTGIYVVSDEIYEKVIYDHMKHFSMGSIDSVRNQVVTVNGVSKVFSMTGWRIGYMGAHKDIIQAAEKVQSQTTSNACSISQRAALAALTNDLESEVRVMVEEFDRRRHFLVREMKKIPHIEFIYPKGSFTLFLNVKSYLHRHIQGKQIKTSDSLCDYFLNEHSVAMVPGTGFGAPERMRNSYPCSIADFLK